MVAAGCRDRVAQAVVRPRCICRTLRAGVVFTFLCRAQSPRDIWTSVVVVAGGSENGGDGAGRKDGGGSATLRRGGTPWIRGVSASELCPVSAVQH